MADRTCTSCDGTGLVEVDCFHDWTECGGPALCFESHATCGVCGGTGTLPADRLVGGW